MFYKKQRIVQYLGVALSILSVSCDKKTDNFLTSEDKVKLSKTNVLSNALSQSFKDSINNLVEDFNLTRYSEPIDQSNVMKEEFNDVASARIFLENFEKSEIVNEHKPIPSTAANTSKENGNIVAQQAFMDSPLANIDFQFSIPSRTFKFASWQWTSPVGFVVQGYLTAYNPVYYSGSGTRFREWKLESMNVHLYGATLFTSYQPSYAYFQPQFMGHNGDFRFAGTVSLHIIIKDIGTIYSIPITGRIMASMGPYYRFSSGWNYEYDGSFGYTQMLYYYISR